MVKRVAKNLDGQGVPAAAYHKPFPKREEWKGATEYGHQVSREIRDKLREFAAHKPNKAWAQRIIDKKNAGKYVSNYALSCATEAIRNWPTSSPVLVARNPGEDDV